MIRTLFIIAGAALVLCIVTVGGAIALGGHDLQRHGWAWTIKDRDGETIRFERVKSGEVEDLGPFTTRTLAWTGGDTLTVDSSIDVEYRQGPENTVVVTGPKALADRVRLDGGRLSLGDGDERIVLSRSMRTTNPEDGAVSIIAINQDVTELRRAEQALAAAQSGPCVVDARVLPGYDRPQ